MLKSDLSISSQLTSAMMEWRNLNEKRVNLLVNTVGIYPPDYMQKQVKINFIFKVIISSLLALSLGIVAVVESLAYAAIIALSFKWLNVSALKNSRLVQKLDSSVFSFCFAVLYIFKFNRINQEIYKYYKNQTPQDKEKYSYISLSKLRKLDACPTNSSTSSTNDLPIEEFMRRIYVPFFCRT